MIYFLLTVSIIALVSICTIAWDKYDTDTKQLKNEIWEKNVLLNYGEVPKAIWHNEQRLNFIRSGIKRVKEAILFCDAGWNNLDNLKVEYPDLKKVDADIATNLFHVWKPNELYPTKESFIEALKMFIPHKKMEEKNGFLNITFPTDLHGYSIHRMLFT